MTILGLPPHPLLVHFAVVLLLAASAAQILAAVLPRFRRWIGWGLPVLAVVTAAVVRLTQRFGEVLQESGRDSPAVRQHAEWGERAGVLAILLAVLSVADWWLASRSASVPGWVRPVVMATAVAVAMAAMTAVTLAGHTGAVSVWG